MFRIGYRTLKTAIGAGIAVAIAQMLELEFFASAGILTILCIQKTRKKTISNSGERFFACIVGIAYSIVLFELIGYHPFSIMLLILLFIPTTLILNIQSGIVTSAVIIFHIYTLGFVNLEVIVNELALITIGIGTAFVMNLYMPGKEKALHRMQDDLEQVYRRIFQEFAKYVRHGDTSWDGQEITQAEELLKKAKNTAIQNLEDHLLRYEDLYYHYFKMREKQLDIIEQMMPLLTSINKHVEQADMLADFMDELAEGVHSKNTAYVYINKLNDLKETFREMPLPKTREEFEARSSLVQLVRELEQYLEIKRQFRTKKEYKAFE
ncbi:aromatic acid exporter family protein [Salisediminibacterium halotolerans]|uniref:Uncharacterized membrane protein YgaE, UPF0421/DUF939 family n=1 Tax=Salisediminibacterium halotolerans TaxID=517425 RepID=A0A1H9PDW1_9BACI|nr:aromatic acid exporter family protein [Salisediminibacterium haloalkalitolerans]SER46342.1 Uncharacterized membrane protein YgaE, UPF0421/DUF939 family [Salisediminibacterium haloalkalitolerans]